VYSRFKLINRVRGYEFEGYERTIDSHVRNVRGKIEDDPVNPRSSRPSWAAVTASAWPAMTEEASPAGPPGPPGRAGRGDMLGLRLALALVSVALAAVALLAGALPEGAGRRDQRVPPGGVNYSMNP